MEKQSKEHRPFQFNSSPGRLDLFIYLLFGFFLLNLAVISQISKTHHAQFEKEVKAVEVPAGDLAEESMAGIMKYEELTD